LPLVSDATASDEKRPAAADGNLSDEKRAKTADGTANDLKRPVGAEGIKAEREARKAAQRRGKADKQASREANRIKNTLLIDQRPHARIAAYEKLHGAYEGSTATAPVTAAGESVGIAKDITGQLGNVLASLFSHSLKVFSLDLLPSNFASLTSLDLSHNELSELPGLESLVSLTELNLCRNWFTGLPFTLRKLPHLAKLNASRNFLKPNAEFMVLLLQAPGLPSLTELDITFNKKCYTKDLKDILCIELPNVAVRVTVTYPPPDGAFVEDAAGKRDATLLRSQLEPYNTQALRRRLVSAFGCTPYSTFGASPPPRSDIMLELLECYAKAGVHNERKKVHVMGTPVDPTLISEILVELKDWAVRNKNHHERPYIHAETYMIIRAPSEFEAKISSGSSGALKAKQKHMANTKLWALASAAMASVDADFASKFTAIAVTHNFRGSPHIDTTNIGPFYGLSIGDYADGTGGVQVEMDPFTVAEVNTKNRLGKVDGRFPHWVAPYDENCERFSLIYYQTEGEVTPSTTAVFGTILEETAAA